MAYKTVGSGGLDGRRARYVSVSTASEGQPRLLIDGWASWRRSQCQQVGHDQ
jgi:hypothetical protein